jgi:hypothetical protein
MSSKRRHWDPESPEEIAELLDTISDKIPNLIRGIMESFFSPEAASNMGKAVAEFRKTLIEGGISEDEAMEMTREYLRTLTNWQGMMREARTRSHRE